MQENRSNQDQLMAVLDRIAVSLEAQSAGAQNKQIEIDLAAADAFVWRPEQWRLEPIKKVARIPLELLFGIDLVREQLVENTERFAAGLPANNALLWGARGTGKSSIVKALHADVAARQGVGEPPLVLVELQREDLSTIETLLIALRDTKARFILFCDDLSFDHDDATYKSLKAVLDGGLMGRPENVLFYATSNRRHLMPRDMIENERATGVLPGETVEEKLSLSDRFGLWLGFHRVDQETYLAMIHAYCAHFNIPKPEDLDHLAKQWATTRGSRSGRVAWQFIQDLAARNKVKLVL